MNFTTKLLKNLDHEFGEIFSNPGSVAYYPMHKQKLQESIDKEVEKNKPARAWAKDRLEEIENKRKGKNL